MRCGAQATCELDPTTRFDLVLTRIALPATQPDGAGGSDDWDGFVWGRADVYLWVEVGEPTIQFESLDAWVAAEMCVLEPMQPTRTMSTKDPGEQNVIELSGEESVLLRGQTVAAFRDYFRLWVWDDDSFGGPGEGPCDSELMNTCTFTPEDEHFGTGSRMWTCEETGTRGQVVFTLELRQPR